jgi:hypothetical protein
LKGLADLVAFDRVKAALKLMMDQNDGKSRIGASHIARLLSQVALEAVRQDPGMPADRKEALKADAQLLRSLADRRHKRDKALGQRNRARLAPLREEANFARLFLLPFAVAKQMERISAPTRGQALLMQ